MKPPTVMGPDGRIHYVYVADGYWTGCGLDASQMPAAWGGETNRCQACVEHQRGEQSDGSEGA